MFGNKINRLSRKKSSTRNIPHETYHSKQKISGSTKRTSEKENFNPNSFLKSRKNHNTKTRRTGSKFLSKNKISTFNKLRTKSKLINNKVKIESRFLSKFDSFLQKRD